MKVNGKTTNGTGEDMKGFKMATYIKENSKTERRKGKASSRGHMEKYTMVSGWVELRKATVSGEAPMAIHTLANGNKARLMATEFMCGVTVTAMKVSGVLASDTEMALISLPTATNTLDSIGMVILMDSANTNGPMGTLMLENFLMV